MIDIDAIANPMPDLGDNAAKVFLTTYARLTSVDLIAADYVNAPSNAPAAIRAQFAARRAFMRAMVAHYEDCVVGKVALGQTRDGQPIILAPKKTLRLSLSSRGKIIALALSRQRVGVDIEPIEASFETPQNIMHPNERRALSQSSDPHASFLRLWTLKEAYLKALGVGFSREPSDIDVRFGAQCDNEAGAANAIEIRDRGLLRPLDLALSRKIFFEDQALAVALIVLPDEP